MRLHNMTRNTGGNEKTSLSKADRIAAHVVRSRAESNAHKELRENAMGRSTSVDKFPEKLKNLAKNEKN